MKTGDLYTHHKGAVYEITGLFKDANTGEQTVAYQLRNFRPKPGDPDGWTLPLSEFDKYVDRPDGTQAKRFAFRPRYLAGIILVARAIYDLSKHPVEGYSHGNVLKRVEAGRDILSVPEHMVPLTQQELHRYIDHLEAEGWVYRIGDEPRSTAILRNMMCTQARGE